VGRASNCWMLNCWCIKWPVGFKRLNSLPKDWILKTREIAMYNDENKVFYVAFEWLISNFREVLESLLVWALLHLEIDRWVGSCREMTLCTAASDCFQIQILETTEWHFLWERETDGQLYRLKTPWYVVPGEQLLDMIEVHMVQGTFSSILRCRHALYF
jgi:hypothetical protein